MKNFLISIAVCVALLPSITNAVTIQELEAQKIKLLEQIVVLLTERLEQLLALHGKQPMVLGVSTTTVSSASTNKVPSVVKKKSGGGGGGGGSSSGGNNPVPLTLIMTGEGNTFAITANKVLDPISMSVTLLSLPDDVVPPLALILRSKISDGSYQDIELIKSVDGLKYSADLRARLASGLTFSGEFEIIFPHPANVERIFYVVDYEGNGVSRTINLGEYGEAIPVITASLDNPDSTTLGVHEEEKSDNYTVFAFDIANQGGAPTKIQNVLIDVSLTPNALITDVISSAVLKIGGTPYSGLVTDEGFLFEGIENVIEGRTTKTVELVIEFLPSIKYSAGQKVSFAIDGDSISAINTDTNIALEVSGDSVGREHTLVAPGLIVDMGSIETNTSTQGENDSIGVFEVSFEITANEDDFYLSSESGIRYVMEGAGTVHDTPTISSTADEETNGVFVIREGESETLTLAIYVTVDMTGQYRMVPTELHFSTHSDGVSNEKVLQLTPATDFRTAYKNINHNMF